MPEKKFKSVIPKHFRSSISKYWEHDFAYLKFGYADHNRKPSLASVVSGHAAARGCIDNPDSYLNNAYLNYKKYFEYMLNLSVPTIVASVGLEKELGFIQSLEDLEVPEPQSYLCADLMYLRSIVFNPPRINASEIDLNNFPEETILSAVKPTTFIIENDDYEFAVRVNSYNKNNKKQKAVFDQYRYEGHVTEENQSVLVFEFLLSKVRITDGQDAAFLSCYYPDGMVTKVASSEIEQLINLACAVVYGLQKGFLKEKDGHGKSAWLQLDKGSVHRTNLPSNKRLYHPRRIERTGS